MPRIQSWIKIPRNLPKAVIGQVTETSPKWKMVKVKVEDLKLDDFLKMVRERSLFIAGGAGGKGGA